MSATRIFYILDPAYRVDTDEKLMRIITNELDLRGRHWWSLDTPSKGNLVKITVTAEFIPEKKEEGIE